MYSTFKINLLILFSVIEHVLYSKTPDLIHRSSGNKCFQNEVDYVIYLLFKLFSE